MARTAPLDPALLDAAMDLPLSILRARDLSGTRARHAAICGAVSSLVDFMDKTYGEQDRHAGAYLEQINVLRVALGLNATDNAPEYFHLGLALVALEHTYRRTLDALGDYIDQTLAQKKPTAAPRYRGTLPALTAAKRRVALLLTEEC